MCYLKKKFFIFFPLFINQNEGDKVYVKNWESIIWHGYHWLYKNIDENGYFFQHAYNATKNKKTEYRIESYHLEKKISIH